MSFLHAIGFSDLSRYLLSHEPVSQSKAQELSSFLIKDFSICSDAEQVRFGLWVTLPEEIIPKRNEKNLHANGSNAVLIYSLSELPFGVLYKTLLGNTLLRLSKNSVLFAGKTVIMINPYDLGLSGQYNLPQVIKLMGNVESENGSQGLASDVAGVLGFLKEVPKYLGPYFKKELKLLEEKAVEQGSFNV